MNNIKATKAINDQELKLGIKASWHDDYKDSAYVYVGGLDPGLTEGDIITIFSQYGEPVDINLPKEKPPAEDSSKKDKPSRPNYNKKKSRGFCFLMYENQLSTNLAVDNLNGAVVLGRTLRVDHCKNYKQLERDQDGKMVERDGDLGERLNARPELHIKNNFHPEVKDGPKDAHSDSHDSIDPEDPMAGYLREKRRKRRDRKHNRKVLETEEERAARKKAKRIKKFIQSEFDDSSGRHDRSDRHARR